MRHTFRTRPTTSLLVLAAGLLAGLAGSRVNAQALTQNQVADILRRGIADADARNINATISVTDREGNILGCVRMVNTTGAAAGRTIPLVSIVGGGGFGGLDVGPLNVAYPNASPLFVANTGGARVATSLTASTKAGTAAYLSTAGNAFTTRTAAFIVQPNFPPRVFLQPSGPLFGVQFSSLPTSDFNRLPLGLSADSGGIPLYINGQCVGGVGVETNDTRTAASGSYGVDTLRPQGTPSTEELIALAAQGSGAAGFAPPLAIRADRIFVNGIRFPYAFAQPPAATAFAAGTSVTFLNDEVTAGRLVILFPVRAAQASQFTSVPLNGVLLNGQQGATVAGFHAAGALVTIAGAINDPDGPGPIVGQQLTGPEVNTILTNAHATNNRLRAMIRRDRPLISQVNVSVVDLDGNILGYYRSPDAPVFGMDVSLQKARSAAFMSRGTTTTRPSTAEILNAAEPGFILDGDGAGPVTNYDKYVTAAAGVNVPLDGSIAISCRAIGALGRPNLPDGIPASRFGPNPIGPFSARGPLPSGFAQPNTFSVFNTGLQTDIILTNLATFLLTYDGGGSATEAANLQAFDANANGDRPLTTAPLPGVPARVSVSPDFPENTLANGLQIFPGSVPLYKNGILVGAVGVSGDGIEQDDNIAFGGSTGFQQLGTVRRSDFVFVGRFLRLPYVKLPRAGTSGL